MDWLPTHQLQVFVEPSGQHHHVSLWKLLPRTQHSKLHNPSLGLSSDESSKAPVSASVAFAHYPKESVPRHCTVLTLHCTVLTLRCAALLTLYCVAILHCAALLTLHCTTALRCTTRTALHYSHCTTRTALHCTTRTALLALHCVAAPGTRMGTHESSHCSVLSIRNT